MAKDHFIIPAKYYFLTFISLIFLTIITVLTAKFLDLGPFNIVLALILATTKALLVLAFFMGLRWDNGFNIAIVISSVFFVILFLVITVLDLGTRGSLIKIEEEKVNTVTPVNVLKK